MLQQPKSLTPALIARNVSFEPRDGLRVVSNLSLSIQFGEKVGLVGKNGVGKSTLLKLLVGELKPTAGVVERKGAIGYLPQIVTVDDGKTVADALGVTMILDAIARIKAGDTSPMLKQLVGNNWDVQSRLACVLAEVGLPNLETQRELSTLSGGERIKVMLAGLLLVDAQLLLLDEPTNNLDAAAQTSIQQLVRTLPQGMLIVSHDRALLDQLDRIIELTPHGLSEYGGNFSEFTEHKEMQLEAALHDVADTKKRLKNLDRQADEVIDSHKKHGKIAKVKLKEKGVSKAARGNMQRHAEKSIGELGKTFESRINQAETEYQSAKAKILPQNQIKVDLSGTSVPDGKLVLDLKDVGFSYGDQPVLSHLNLAMYGPERVALLGPNGSGKTTLIKLILGERHPSNGEIRRAPLRTGYLDQHTSSLKNGRTLLEDFQDTHHDFNHTEARWWLGRFLFPDDAVHTPVEGLSGGERMRAALAKMLAGKEPPQLLILDEPTNNLDLDSVQKLESALDNYKGTLIVISHDQAFRNAIGITREVQLNK